MCLFYLGTKAEAGNFIGPLLAICFDQIQRLGVTLFGSVNWVYYPLLPVPVSKELGFASGGRLSLEDPAQMSLFHTQN